MKIGYIESLNCYPFYYRILEKMPIFGVEIVHGHPHELDKMMKKNKLDFSPISSAAYAEIHKDLLVLPDYCLNTINNVRSMTLLSKMPIEDLDYKKIGITLKSQTSAILLNILMKKYYNLSPKYFTLDSNPSLNYLDAFFLEGNERELENNEPAPYSYDIGDLWQRKTGHPVVLTLFAVQKKAAKEQLDMVKRIVMSYEDSISDLKSNEDELANMAARRYPDVKYNINFYYRGIQFDFNKKLKDALAYFFKEAASLDLLGNVEEIEYFDV